LLQTPFSTMRFPFENQKKLTRLTVISLPMRAKAWPQNKNTINKERRAQYTYILSHFQIFRHIFAYGVLSIVNCDSNADYPYQERYCAIPLQTRSGRPKDRGVWVPNRKSCQLRTQTTPPDRQSGQTFIAQATPTPPSRPRSGRTYAPVSATNHN